MEPISSQEAIPDARVSKFLEDMMPTKLFCRKSKQSWVFWSQEASTYWESKQLWGETSTYWQIQQRIITALSEDWGLIYGDPLVQFWAAEMIGDQRHLTTTLQPFALSDLTNGKLIQYRKFCIGSNLSVVLGENMDGILGRVFRNKLLEVSPDLSYYSITEYPQRDLALSCGFNSSVVFPVLEPSQRFCVGVLELLYPTYYFEHTIHILVSMVNTLLKGVHLGTIEVPQLRLLQIQNIFEVHVEKEIKAVLKTTCKKYELPFASVWVRGAHISCLDHDSFSHTSYNDFRVSCEGELLVSVPNMLSLFNMKLSGYYYTSLSVPLNVRQGLAGKAALSRKPYLCRDVCELSIIDYPLAHCVRKSGLAGCFAVCLRTISTGNHEYVIEFFLPKNKTYRDLHSYISSILTTMKHQLKTFEVVTGDIGNDLFIEVDKFSFHKEVESFTEFPTTNTQLEFEALRNDGEVLQSDHSIDHQLVIEDIDVLEQPEIGISSDEIAISFERIPLVNQAQSLEKKSSCSRKDLEQHFGKKLKDAADILGVSRSTLKRLCREHNIMRWPSPKRSKVCSLSSIPKQTDVLTQGNVEPILQDAVTDPCCSKRPTNVELMPATSMITVKAAYGGNFLMFKLSYPSRMTDLVEKVIVRTKLRDGTFNITYLDEENDPIVLACDEDLQNCVDSLRFSGTTAIRMQIEPIVSKSP